MRISTIAFIALLGLCSAMSAKNSVQLPYHDIAVGQIAEGISSSLNLTFVPYQNCVNNGAQAFANLQNATQLFF